MNLRDLSYLVAVAETGHFGDAADQCHVTQPTLSAQIRKLERELGVQLIERLPRGAVLTTVGEQVVEHARAALREAAAIRGVAEQAKDPYTASLRLGVFPTLAPYLLPHVVGNVHERFPNLELLLVEEKTDDVLAGLRDGDLDVGVLALPVDDPRLHTEPLFDEDFLLAVPADHPLADATAPVDPGVLATESVLLLEDGHCMREQALAVCSLANATERRGFRATSLETLRQMVASGVGVTLLPRLAVSPPVTRSEAIALVPFADPVPQRHIAMFWRTTSPYAELLIDLAEVFRDLPEDLVHPVTLGS